MKIQPIRGTHDIYGKDLLLYRFIEKTISDLAQVYDYNEIITPIFEKTKRMKIQGRFNENSEMKSKGQGE